MYWLFKEVSYAHQSCIYLIKNTVKCVVLSKLLQFQIIHCNCLLEYILKCNLFL